MTKTAYDRCMKAMFSLRRFGIKLEMDTIESMLHALGNPHKAYGCIHIAGTNGKGSTASILSTILHAAGVRVGRYTSPHLERFNERICINNRPIENHEVVHAYERVSAFAPPLRQPTFFEFSTAMALFEFARQGVAWAVIETGMGGRMDATNVIQPAVCIISNVSLEHKDYLGRSIAAIAGEKAGIIKAHIPVVTGVRQKTAWEVIFAAASRCSAPLYRMGVDFSVRRRKQGFTYSGMQTTWGSLSLNLQGDHQVDNAGLALAACELLSRKGLVPINEAAIRTGLAQTTWPGRLEVALTSPWLILDGAHNLMAARQLAKYLKQNLSGRRITLVIGILDDKPYKQMLADLAPCCERMIITQAAIERAIPATILAKEARKVCRTVDVVAKVRQALKRALSDSAPGDAICVAGSLYVVGEAKTALAAIGPSAKKTIGAPAVFA